MTFLTHTATGAFDIVGQKIQGNEYRPGQTLLAMQTGLTFAPVAGTSWVFNSVLGVSANGSNTAMNNFYYDENQSVRQAVA